MASRIKNQSSGPSREAEWARSQELTAAINERLILSSLREHQLREVAERLNAQLQAEITERKQAEKALRESEERFRALVTARSDVVYLMSPDWREMRQLHGRKFITDTEGPSGSWLQEYIHPDDQPHVMAVIKEAIRRKSVFELEHRVRRIDGTFGWTFSRAVPLLDARGEIIEWFGAATDVTERKQAEEAEHASAERFRFLAESMPQKIFTATPSGEIDYFNRQWMEFTALSLEQIGGSGWLQFIHPDEVEENVRRWKHSVETSEDFEFEHRFRRHDGVYRWHLSRAQALRDREGKVVMWIGSSTDINDRKDAEEALHVAMTECKSASRAKDDFLAALSHELRTPLTPVLLTATALESDLALPPDLRDRLAMMRRNIQLEARLIDDLLDITRISRGKLQIKPVITDLHQLLEQTVEIVRDSGLDKHVCIDFALEAGRHHVMGDPARLQQVFWNIIKNALKFTPAGGRVSVSTRNHGAGTISVSVTDTGIGIGAKALSRIFESFEQGETTFQQRFGGLGLGLAISRAIVEMHGGEIHAESEGVGRGATFVVTLTTVDAPQVTHRVQSRAPAAGRALRLLVVDDHEATLGVLTRLLRGSGHDLTPASSVGEALEAAATGNFDAVISDLGLPDGTGFELMEKLRAEHGLRGIALSGYGMDQDVRRSYEAGFGAHLTKPIDFAQLERALEDVMAHATVR